jgi:hypothetical protein
VPTTRAWILPTPPLADAKTGQQIQRSSAEFFLMLFLQKPHASRDYGDEACYEANY